MSVLAARPRQDDMRFGGRREAHHDQELRRIQDFFFFFRFTATDRMGLVFMSIAIAARKVGNFGSVLNAYG